MFKEDQKAGLEVASSNQPKPEDDLPKAKEDSMDDSPRGQLKEFLKHSPKAAVKRLNKKSSSLMRERQRQIQSLTANDLGELSEALYNG